MFNDRKNTYDMLENKEGKIQNGICHLISTKHPSHTSIAVAANSMRHS